MSETWYVLGLIVILSSGEKNFLGKYNFGQLDNTNNWSEPLVF